MDPSLLKQISVVQTVLGKYVKKPPLVEKHLGRPPFRFLHDVFLSVMNGTGFYQGLFTPGEIDSSALNTKEEKTEFLSKIIKVTELTTDTKVEAKVSKILAGQDPDKTLDFLMLLGGALDKGLSSKDSVATVLGSGDPAPVDEKKKANPDVSSRPKEKTPTMDSVPGKAKDKTVKKSPAQAPVKSGATAAASSSSSTNQKPTTSRQGDKEKSPNVKPSTKSKVKAPASKGSKSTSNDIKVVEKSGNDGKTARLEEKRERSRSRDDAKPVASQQSGRRDSKSREKATPPGTAVGKNEPPPPLTKVPSKEDVKNPDEGDSKRRQSTSKERPATKSDNEVEKIGSGGEPAESEQAVPDPVPPVKNEEDSIQFMGEVESLLQEHGIKLEQNQSSHSEKRKKSSVERKQSGGVKTVAEKPLSQNAGQEKDVILNEVVGLDEDSTRNVLNPDPPPQQLSIIPTSLHVAHSDESDVDTDESDIVPLGNAKQKAGLGRKQPESGNSEGEGGRNIPQVGRPPSSFARPTSARPAPPRPKTAMVEEEVVYRPPTTKIPVILDSEEVEEEETGDNRKQELLSLLTATPTSGSKGIGFGDLSNFEGKGYLVQQILETKRELEGGDSNRDEDEMRKLRKQTQAELEALKGLIQSSARLANPLARILDFLQEDIDAMTAEYVKFNAEGKRLNELLEKEKEITRQHLKPKRLELLELMDKLEQQNFEIRAAHNDLHTVEEHLRNYMASVDSAPDKVEIPTRFLINRDWEFDLDAATEEHGALEKKAKPRRGAFGEFPPFLSVSAEAREQDKLGGKGFNIPKPKRKAQQQPMPSFIMKKEFKKPTFAIEPDEVVEEPGMGFYAHGKPKYRHVDRRRSSQFLEPPEPELDSLEILGDN